MQEQKARSSRAASQFSLLSFVWRLAGALVLVLATYNPSGVSYFHWVRGAIGAGDLGAVHFFTGALVVAGWAVMFIASRRSLGPVGLVLTAALIGTFVWLLTDIGVVAANSTTAITWISLLCLAALLAVGLSWSHVWRRLTGQLEVDDAHD